MNGANDPSKDTAPTSKTSYNAFEMDKTPRKAFAWTIQGFITNTVELYTKQKMFCCAENFVPNKHLDYVWLWGATGVGKSHTAFAGFNPETHYVKTLEDEWWDGYTGQATVILNDFRGQIVFSNLLTLIDKWPTSVKRRGREPFPFISKQVIITSDKPPEIIYYNVDKDRIGQLLRRIEIHEVTARDQ